MNRFALLALLTLGTLIAASPANAAIPRAGIGIVDGKESCFIGCAYNLGFIGALGPLGGNKLTVELAADGSHWTLDAPQTVMIVQPRPLSNQRCTATVFRHAVCAMRAASDGYSLCNVNLSGNLGPDVITVRNLASGPTACSNSLTAHIGTLNNNDVINARDGFHTEVDCGPGYDVANLDFGDTATNCESVRRG